MINLDRFIYKYVVRRECSMFEEDINRNNSILQEKINGKTILVIGGAGSIGSSFIRAVLHYKPASLVVVDINENALAELTRDLRSSYSVTVPQDYITYPMDFDSEVFRKMFISRNGFDIVANFSAHKHVRSEKDIFSIEALINNNVLHAKRLLDLLAEYPPETYFCVSTDKAANPVNIMGASKRVMEDVIFAYSDMYPVKTARFANVAFSNGSLPAGFLTRIQKMQPISAPSDVKRYFVSPEESGQICMLACMLGNNREIFFPKLAEAEMMTFDCIARDLLKEYGFEVKEFDSDEDAIKFSEKLKDGDKLYPVHFSKTDTSGEKSFEEFYTNQENVDLERLVSLGAIVNKEVTCMNKVDILYNELNNAFANVHVTKEKIVSILKEYLDNFEHIETGKSLDSKM